MTDTDEETTTVPIVCPDCGTATRIPLDDVADRLQRHNDNQHDGEQVAQVDPDLADQLADIVAEEMGLL